MVEEELEADDVPEVDDVDEVVEEDDDVTEVDDDTETKGAAPSLLLRVPADVDVLSFDVKREFEMGLLGTELVKGTFANTLSSKSPSCWSSLNII